MLLRAQIQHWHLMGGRRGLALPFRPGVPSGMMGDPGLFGKAAKWLGKAAARTVKGKAFGKLAGLAGVALGPMGTLASGLLSAAGKFGGAPGGMIPTGIPGVGMNPFIPPDLGGGFMGPKGPVGEFGLPLAGPSSKGHGAVHPLHGGGMRRRRMNWANPRALGRAERRLGSFLHHFTKTARFLGVHVGRTPRRSRKGAFPRRKR
jgi:hypothetical protein